MTAKDFLIEKFNEDGILFINSVDVYAHQLMEEYAEIKAKDAYNAALENSKLAANKQRRYKVRGKIIAVSPINYDQYKLNQLN